MLGLRIANLILISLLHFESDVLLRCRLISPNLISLNLQYVSNTYVNPLGALSDVQQWNVYGTENRTINMCEGFHSAQNKAVVVRHPTVFSLIEVLQDVEASNERIIAQLALGAPPKQKEKYVRVNEAIQRLTSNTFGGGIVNMIQMMNYVDAVAYQLWDVKH